MKPAIERNVWIRCDALNRGTWDYDPDPHPDNPASFPWDYGFNIQLGKRYQLTDPKTHETILVEITSVEGAPRNHDSIAIAKIVGVEAAKCETLPIP